MLLIFKFLKLILEDKALYKKILFYIFNLFLHKKLLLSRFAILDAL